MFKKHCFFLLMELKLAIKLIPKMFAGAVVFSLLSLLIGYAGTKLLYGSGSSFFFRIATVLPENDSLVNIGFNMISEMDSLKDYCEFIRTDPDTAAGLLKDGEVYGIVEIPPGFVEDVLNGTNTPARIILPDNAGMEAVLFRSVLNAGSATLAYVQSGIYAVTDTYFRYGLTAAEVAAATDKLNSEYIRFVLNRGTFIDKETVSSTGALTLAQFFVCCGVLLLMLFSGMTLNSYVAQESGGLITLLRRNGISPFFLVLSKVLMTALLYGVLFLFLIAAAKLAVIKGFPENEGLRALFFDFTPANIGIFFFVTVLFAAYTAMVFTLAGSGLYGTLLLFVLNIVMLFASGCILPGAYLPKAVASAGSLLPTALFRRLLGGMYTHEFNAAVFFGACLYLALFLALGAILKKGERR